MLRLPRGVPARASYIEPRAAVAPNFDGFEERSRRAFST
jgi:hypothetical protein